MANRQFTVPTGSAPGSGGGGGGSGTVTSVGLADSTGLFTVTGSPVTTSGTLTLSAFANQTANSVLAGPTSGGAASSSFRALVSADLPANTGTVTSVTFTGDGTVLSSTPSSAVTATGTLTAALANAGGGTVLGRTAGTSGAPSYTTAPVLGIAGTSTGTVALTGATSGTVTITAQATAGTPTLTLPNASGTFAISASAPLVLNATTGALTTPTAVTSAASLTSNAVVLGAGGQATATNTAFVTNGTTTLTVGIAGGGNGVLALSGNTSGTATFTAPAVAGTSTNPIVISNAISLPDGAAAAPAILINDVGFYRSTTTTMRFNTSGTDRLLFNTASVQPVTAGGISLGAVGTFFASSFFSQLNIVTTSNAAQWNQANISELITLNTGAATTDSVANLLPANSIIEAVVARITTTITTAANWSLGDATTAARFMSSNSTLTSGTTATGLNVWDPTLATATASGPTQSAAAKLRITLNANPGAGVIRVTVFYRTFVPPTS